MTRAREAETVPVEAFLADYPRPIADAAERLRALVRRAVPEVVERVRPGWRLIGYELPLGRRRRYFAYVAPEEEHVHLGFEYGAWMADPSGILEGAHLRLRQVRYLTFRPGEPFAESEAEALVAEAARVAGMTAAERVAAELDRDWLPVEDGAARPG